MKNWKEVGEVPDSDDESAGGFDTDESQTVEPALPPSIKPPSHIARQKSATDDIWELPVSSPEQQSKAANLSRHLEPFGNKRNASEIVEDAPTDDAAASQAPNVGNPVPSSAEASALDTVFGILDHEESNVSSPSSTLTSPPASPNLIPVRDSPTRADHTPEDAHAISRRQTVAEEDGEQESRLAAVRLERSLRPRKPIQEHPYLLESALYSNLMKSRGVQPVRIPRPLEQAKIVNDDPDDEDFEADESQGVRRETQNLTGEESGPLSFDNNVSDVDELALSPVPNRSSIQPGALSSSLSSSPLRNSYNGNASVEEDEDEDDLPSLEEILRNPERVLQKTKRQRLGQVYSARKRRKEAAQVLPLSSPPREFIRPPRLSPSPEPQVDAGPSSDLGTTPVPRRKNRIEIHIPSGLSQVATPSPASPITRETVDLTTLIDADDSDTQSTSSGSSSDLEVARHHVRRIRGVLPASWLRLDQVKGKDTIQQHINRLSEQSVEPEAPRRGVAILRQSKAQSPRSTAFALEDYSDEESDGPGNPPQSVEPESRNMSSGPSIFDDADPGSVMEDNSIDRVVLGTKRNHSSGDGSRKAKKSKTQQSIFKGRLGEKTRQPRINQILGRAKSTSRTSAGNTKSSARRTVSVGPRRAAVSRPRSSTPPLLSILDVMEPQAPNFIKIAARTAKRRKNLGKASPSRKLISLATRTDNIDALSSLRDWKSGRTQPRISIPRETTRQSDLRRPLAGLDPNLLTPKSYSAKPAPSRPPAHSTSQRVAKQSGLDGFVTTTGAARLQERSEAATHVQPLKPSSKKVLQLRKPQFRPAQLETDDAAAPDRNLFTIRKRALDAIYQKSRNAQGLRAPSIASLESYFGSLSQATREPIKEPKTTDIEPPRPPGLRVKSRFRKKFVPKRIDLDTPQYIHAHDPLPVIDRRETPRDLVPSEELTEGDKLGGLGPFGTVYTQHFEIFPLDQGTYFHASTLIGRGYVTKPLDLGFPTSVRSSRSRIAFRLGAETLRWGPWDDSTSSEFGILVDWVADKLILGPSEAEISTAAEPVGASQFVLDYALSALSLQNDDESKAFILRSVEVFQGFLNRLESSPNPITPSHEKDEVCAEVCVRLSLVTLAIYQLAQASSLDYSLVVQIEELLKKMAKLCMKSLLNTASGEELRNLYGHLQRVSARECGIRSDQVAANCWVILMRIFENIHIPRCSFWDVVNSVMLESEGVAGTDSQKFEALWSSMFTLLPLSEFDNSGVLVSGLRYMMPMEGWALPQQLSKRVFDLYRANPRQPPSFNEYCRAVIARCHYLVQQWGWSRCSSIIGTIFDFFGSQKLAHLRNEEVYKSPAFLENLGNHPSLAIEPDDRCFHIFIKMLAQAILRLKKLDRQKDIRNLVARTLPNHDRQYNKEDTIHQHDLAALRNHHDLLCTLFWAAPPELRPGVHLIEKLVSPEHSHKEACLINLRAWGQLATFMIASGEVGTGYRPFISWLNNIFQHLLDQYLSAASDIEQQFKALSSETRGIGNDIKDQMILRNKAAAMDVLFTSVKTSLAVLKHSRTLGAAAYCLSTYQLQRVFGSLDFSSPHFDWSIVNVALDTLEYYLTRLAEAKSSEEQYSSDEANDFDPRELEDAVQLLDVHIVKDFFFMGRTCLTLPLTATPRRLREQVMCVEKTVRISSSIAARFFKDRITLLAPYFTSPKYGLFRALPKHLDSADRKYLPLFLAGLISNHIYAFNDLGSTLIELWMLAITKPSHLLQYENHLANILKHNGLPFLQRATIPATTPDYNANHGFFACAVHHMRMTLREAGSMQARKLRAEYKDTLVLVMSKMRRDLQELVPRAQEHKAYIGFVRQIVSLIKSHGVGICVVDPFFTQPSLEYSPPVQDPQLHIDGIIGYGVKIGEKDPTAIPQLFHYLFNNFKIALANNKVEEERTILEKAMGNPDVVTFVLQFMLPAIIEAVAQTNDAWMLLQVYVGAIRGLLTRSCMPKQLRGQDLAHSASLLGSILACFAKFREINTDAISLPQLYIIDQLATLANAQQCSLSAWLYISPGSEDTLDASRGTAEEAVKSLASMTQEAAPYLTNILAHGSGQLREPGDVLAGELSSEPPLEINIQSLFTGLSLVTTTNTIRDPRVTSFASHIVGDVKRNWILLPGLVTVKVAGKPVGGAITSTPMATGSQSCNGTSYGPWNMRGLAGNVCQEMERWKLDVVQLSDGPGGERAWTGARRQLTRPREADDLIF